MAGSFDPYHRWLGIRRDEHPVSHYRLLGLSEGEDDLDTIHALADARIAHVRSHQHGPQAADAQRILNELSSARLCLLDPVQRARYDQQRAVSPQPAAAPTPSRAPAAPDAPFDPYHRWLGIHPHERPITNYRLLGIAEDETDVEVIGSQADARMAHVRTYQSGAHSAHSQRILNELSAARHCLLDPAKRARYDAQLRGQLEPPPPEAPLASTPVQAALETPPWEGHLVSPRSNAPDDLSVVSRPVSPGVPTTRQLDGMTLLPPEPIAPQPAPREPAARHAPSLLGSEFDLPDSPPPPPAPPWQPNWPLIRYAAGGLAGVAILAMLLFRGPSTSSPPPPGTPDPSVTATIVPGMPGIPWAPQPPGFISAVPSAPHLVAAVPQKAPPSPAAVLSAAVGQVFKLQHPQAIGTAALSHDGKQALTGCVDGIVRLWNLEDGSLVREFRGHTSGCWSVLFSPDGRLAASSAFDNKVILWDLSTGRMHRELLGHTARLARMAFSPDGKRLYSPSYDLTLRVWDVATGDSQVWKLNGQEWPNCLAVSWDDQFIACGGIQGFLYIFDLEGTSVHCLPGAGPPVEFVAWAHDGRRLLAGYSDGLIKLWDLDTSQVVRQFTDSTKPGRFGAFAPDGKHLVLGCIDGALRICNADSGAEVQRLTGHEGEVRWVEVAPDGRMAITASMDHSLRVWRLPESLHCEMVTPRAPTLPKLMPQSSARLVLERRTAVPSPAVLVETPSPRVMAASDGTLVTWMLDGGAAEPRPIPRRNVKLVAATPDGSRLAVHDGETTMLIDVATGGLVRFPTGPVLSVAVAPAGDLLATADGKEAILWRPNSTEPQRRLPNSSHVRFRSDGTLAAGGAELVICKPSVDALERHTGNAVAAISESGQHFATWDPPSVMVRRVKNDPITIDGAWFANSRNPDTPLVVSHDGARVVWFDTAHAAHLVAAVGRPLVKIPLAGPASHASWSPSGRLLIQYHDPQDSKTPWVTGVWEVEK